MGFRFQKRIKLLPGLTANLSRKGVSTSVGTTGARVTLGHGQQRTTVGVPGSGISHTAVNPSSGAGAVFGFVAVMAGVLASIFSTLMFGGKRKKGRRR